MSEVSLKMFYFALFDDGTYFKNFEIGVYRFLNSNSSNILNVEIYAVTSTFVILVLNWQVSFTVCKTFSH